MEQNGASLPAPQVSQVTSPPVVSLTGFHGKERAKARLLVERVGGQCIAELCSQRTTHLVCRSFVDAVGSTKFTMAMEWGIPVVHIDWLVDSLSAGKLLPTANYKTDRGSVAYRRALGAMATPGPAKPTRPAPPRQALAELCPNTGDACLAPALPTSPQLPPAAPTGCSHSSSRSTRSTGTPPQDAGMGCSSPPQLPPWEQPSAGSSSSTELWSSGSSTQHAAGGSMQASLGSASTACSPYTQRLYDAMVQLRLSQQRQEEQQHITVTSCTAADGQGAHPSPPVLGLGGTTPPQPFQLHHTPRLCDWQQQHQHCAAPAVGGGAAGAAAEWCLHGAHGSPIAGTGGAASTPEQHWQAQQPAGGSHTGDAARQPELCGSAAMADGSSPGSSSSGAAKPGPAWQLPTPGMQAAATPCVRDAAQHTSAPVQTPFTLSTLPLPPGSSVARAELRRNGWACAASGAGGAAEEQDAWAMDVSPAHVPCSSPARASPVKPLWELVSRLQGSQQQHGSPAHKRAEAAARQLLQSPGAAQQGHNPMDMSPMPQLPAAQTPLTPWVATSHSVSDQPGMPADSCASAGAGALPGATTPPDACQSTPTATAGRVDHTTPHTQAAGASAALPHSCSPPNAAGRPSQGRDTPTAAQDNRALVAGWHSPGSGPGSACATGSACPATGGSDTTCGSPHEHMEPHMEDGDTFSHSPGAAGSDAPACSSPPGGSARGCRSAAGARDSAATGEAAAAPTDAATRRHRLLPLAKGKELGRLARASSYGRAALSGQQLSGGSGQPTQQSGQLQSGHASASAQPSLDSDLHSGQSTPQSVGQGAGGGAPTPPLPPSAAPAQVKLEPGVAVPAPDSCTASVRSTSSRASGQAQPRSQPGLSSTAPGAAGGHTHHTAVKAEPSDGADAVQGCGSGLLYVKPEPLDAWPATPGGGCLPGSSPGCKQLQGGACGGEGTATPVGAVAADCKSGGPTARAGRMARSDGRGAAAGCSGGAGGDGSGRRAGALLSLGGGSGDDDDFQTPANGKARVAEGQLDAFLREAVEFAPVPLRGPAADADVAVVKALLRPPRNHTIRHFHGLPHVREVDFAEQLKLLTPGLVVSTKDKCVFQLVRTKLGGARVAVLAEPASFYCIKGQWWLEFQRYLSARQAQALAREQGRQLELPRDFVATHELLRDTQRHHARVARILGSVKVRKVKKAPLLSKLRPGDPQFFWRCYWLDAEQQRVLTDQSVADFVIE